MHLLHALRIVLLVLFAAVTAGLVWAGHREA